VKEKNKKNIVCARKYLTDFWKIINLKLELNMDKRSKNIKKEKSKKLKIK